MSVERHEIRIGFCTTCHMFILEPPMKEAPVAPSGFTSDGKCECGGALSTVISTAMPGTRIGNIRPFGAYWVRTKSDSVELMEWRPKTINGLPLPEGTWVPFDGPDYDLSDGEVEILEGPLEPPKGAKP